MDGILSTLDNVLGIITAVLAVIAWYFRRKVKNKEGRIRDLEEEKANIERKLDDERSERKKHEELCGTLESHLPQTALETAETETRDGNFNLADRVLRIWIENEGQPISELLFLRGRWSAAHAVGDVRAAALVKGRSFMALPHRSFGRRTSRLPISLRTSSAFARRRAKLCLLCVWR